MTAGTAGESDRRVSGGDPWHPSAFSLGGIARFLAGSPRWLDDSPDLPIRILRNRVFLRSEIWIAMGAGDASLRVRPAGFLSAGGQQPNLIFWDFLILSSAGG